VTDPVKGTSHFDVPLERAQAIHFELQSLISGYLVPKLVQEVAENPAKTLVNHNF
jgi:L-lysine 2,3-aminomutase